MPLRWLSILIVKYNYSRHALVSVCVMTATDEQQTLSVHFKCDCSYGSSAYVDIMFCNHQLLFLRCLFHISPDEIIIWY